MAFCFIGLEQGGVLELEQGGYLVAEEACPLSGGAHVRAYGAVPGWWEGWHKEEARRIRMRKSSKERIAELFSQTVKTIDR